MGARVQTLAESLGVDVVPPGDAIVSPLDITDAKAFSLAVVSSIEFRRYIMVGLALGTLPGFTSILGRLLDHAWGKPVERVEVKDTTVPVESLTADQLEERAMRLAEMARFMRRAEEFDEPPATDAVH